MWHVESMTCILFTGVQFFFVMAINNSCHWPFFGTSHASCKQKIVLNQP